MYTGGMYCRIYEVYSDHQSGKVSMVLELLDLDLYRLMRSHPMLMPSNPNLVKVRIISAYKLMPKGQHHATGK